MTRERDRPRGRLFENKEKRKPSQPDLQGNGRIAGQPLAITAWIREERLVMSWAPPRGRDSRSYPPELYRGSLVTGDAQDDAVWVGRIEGEDATFAVRCYERQGKSGTYLELDLQPAPHVTRDTSSEPLPALDPDL